MNELLTQEVMKLGCPSENEAALVLQVYLELTEVKKFWDVEYNFDKKLSKMYLTGRKTKNSNVITFVPVPVSQTVSFDLLETYIHLCTDQEDKSICLVVCCPDSTCVYYEISDGIKDIPVENPSKSTQNERDKLDKALIKHRELLEQGAMYSLPITLPKINKSEGELKSKEKFKN